MKITKRHILMGLSMVIVFFAGAIMTFLLKHPQVVIMSKKGNFDQKVNNLVETFPDYLVEQVKRENKGHLTKAEVTSVQRESQNTVKLGFALSFSNEVDGQPVNSRLLSSALLEHEGEDRWKIVKVTPQTENVEFDTAMVVNAGKAE